MFKMSILSQIPECSIDMSNHTFNSNSDSNSDSNSNSNSNSNSMAISTVSTVLASLTEALNLSCQNSMRMALPMFIILVPLEIFSFLIKRSSLFVIDLTALINRSSPEFPFVVLKTKAEIRLDDLLISILSAILIAQFSCMARSNDKASLDYYIKGLQKIWCGSVAALSCAKLFYMLSVLIITFLERNTRAVQFLQRDKMLVFVLLLKVAWMILLTLVEQWSLVIVLVEGGNNGFSAIAKALAFVGKRKRKVFFLMGGITVIKFMAWMLLDFVISDNLKVGKVGLFRLDSIADNTFCYFVRFYTYLLYMVFYERERIL